MFRRLHCKGIGTETKVTAVISAMEEDTLWESGVINLETPDLQDCFMWCFSKIAKTSAREEELNIKT